MPAVRGGGAASAALCVLVLRVAEYPPHARTNPAHQQGPVGVAGADLPVGFVARWNLV